MKAELAALDSDEAEYHKEVAEFNAVNDALQHWENLEDAERRAVYKRLFQKVYILPASRAWGRRFQPDRVVPWWTGGTEPDVEAAQRELDLATAIQNDAVRDRKAREAAIRRRRRPK